ncbi:rRNA biogenesis protein rrp5 [Aricia agestis]|uniref:rRNA biogenesis protein rrp5 n=1 Tax=Aricia agestis TaxID=91739 RepID=UPI001C20960E|nr:rRNA biogenesis protein rrp5 [Aricia agestis]
MGDNEDYFPRGGKKPTSVRFKQSSNFLGGITQEEGKKKKPKKTENDDGYLSDEITPEVDHSYKSCGIWLNYKVVREGLLMLGRVREVLETKLSVSLPCRMLGFVMACHISEAYNKQLEAYVNDQVEEVSDLKKMFLAGQYVVVKVLEVTDNHLMLSLMPQHINTGRLLTDLKKGMVLQAAVSSVEDHGYIMDIGIPNAKVFLPKDSANPELELLTGGVCWCVVKSVSPDSAVVTVSGELGSMQRAVQRHPAPGGLLPGTQIEFTVDKPLDNGIEGRILDDVTAYIQRHHVESIKGKKPGLGQKIRARLLYCVPPKNIPFLTMHGAFDSTYPDLAEEQKLADGDIIEDATVIKIMNRSVYLSLGGGGLALLSLRRLRVHEDLSDEDVVAKSYPIGSKHRVRVLGYSLADRLYSVSDQRAVLDEPYFSLSQLAAGDIVPATVAEIQDKHLKLNIGRLKGIVPLAHMTESGVFVDPKKATTSNKSKKKFKVGQSVSARVLQVDEARHTALLTLKPSLLDPALTPLTSYHDAEVGKQYTGVIVHIRDYLIVKFFNEVAAYVPRVFVSAAPVDSLTDAFHVGQIVKCTILTVKPEEKKMSASLTTAPFDPTVNRKTKRKSDGTQQNKFKKPKVEEVESDSDKDSEDEDDSLSKKRKKNDRKADNKGKKDKVQNDDESDENTQQDAVSKKKKKKGKKESNDNDSKKKNTEDSDAIETDVQEEQEILAPEDLNLMDFSDCTTEKNIKKRVVSLIKAVKARKRRLGIVVKKIAAVEEKGLNPKNKKYHTAMNLEKIVLQERVTKLKEALTEGEKKLQDLNIEFSTDPKKRKSLRTSESDKDEESVAPKKSKLKEEKVNKKEKKVEDGEEKEDKDSKTEEVMVLDSLQPVLRVPSIKEFWSENTNTSSVNNKEEESSSSEDEEEDKPKKKRKKLSPAEKLAKARAEEQRVREMEQRAIDNDAPRSVDQFQRALLAAPNSSQLWIAYMAFHLQATEIEKARGVARKALTTINFREEAERRNVWLALLNLEHRFGTKESQQKTLEEALQMNDTYSIHSKLLEILVDTGKTQELSALTELMMRRYRGSVEAYTTAGAACYRAGLLDKARQVMQKGIASLDKKEHVSLLMSFAKLERAAGAFERAEALCEQVLAVYPARVDVAAAYVDMLIKGRQLDQARQVLDRLTSLQLPARKMKVLYKKWIEVEERNGDEEHVQAVRQRAKNFLDNAKF